MRLLITGGGGFLGAELVRQGIANEHVVTAGYHNHPGTVPGATWLPLDIRDRVAVEAAVDTSNPDLIINTAYRQTDWVTTADGAANVALAAAGRRLVHVSSDAIFSGNAERYTESCTPDPITPYGAAKAAAETAVRAIAPEAMVIRTSLIIGDGGSVHERRVVALADGHAAGVLFTDDLRCPVHVSDLAAAMFELADGEQGGIFHLAGPDPLSRHELGCLIAVRDGRDPTALPSALRAETAVTGPLKVRLDGTATQRMIRTRLRGAREFLTRTENTDMGR